MPAKYRYIDKTVYKIKITEIVHDEHKITKNLCQRHNKKDTVKYHPIQRFNRFDSRHNQRQKDQTTATESVLCPTTLTNGYLIHLLTQRGK